MTLKRHFLALLLESFAFSHGNRSPSRLVFAGLFSAYFMLFLYLELPPPACRVASLVPAALVAAAKLVLLFGRRCLNATLEISPSEPDAADRPLYISPYIWQFAPLLADPAAPVDLVVSDLIASGVDQGELLELLDYVQSAGAPLLAAAEPPDARPVALFVACGRVVRLPFSHATLAAFFPLEHTVPFILAAGALQFASGWLVLGLAAQFHAAEKWWVAVILGLSTFSVLFPSPFDVYMVKQNDCWNGAGRALALTVCAGAWQIALACRAARTNLGYWSFNWAIVVPYIFVLSRFAIHLLPIWTFFGFLSHPKMWLNALLESINRYAFGQAGVISYVHWITQLLRGVLSVGAIWVFLLINGNKGAISGVAFAVSTVINLAVLFDPRRNWKVYLLYPAIATLAVCLFSLLSANVDLEILATIAVVFLLLSDVLLPQLSVRNTFWSLIFQLWPVPIIGTQVRWWLSSVLWAIPFAFFLSPTDQPALLVAFVATHAIHKAHTSRHFFAIACVIALYTFPSEFDLTTRPLNFLFALLIVTKYESFSAAAHLITHTHCWDDDYDEILIWVFWRLTMVFPILDSIYKIPGLLWSLLTGSLPCLFRLRILPCPLVQPPLFLLRLAHRHPPFLTQHKIFNHRRLPR
jgi:hypothetical protein